MIKYDRLWKTMKERGISQYDYMNIITLQNRFWTASAKISIQKFTHSTESAPFSTVILRIL